MANTNDFLPFAVGANANVLSQSDYAALNALAGGFQAGTAVSAQLNKVWRQSSIMSAVLAQFIVNNSGQSALDDGTTTSLLDNLTGAIRSLSRQQVVLADTGAANAYAAVNSPVLVALPAVSGLVQRVSVGNANTGASTYAPDGLTAKPILGMGLAPLQGGELPPKGIATLLYVVASNVNSGNGAWLLVECTGGAQQIPNATQSQHALALGQLQAVAGSAGSPAFRNVLIDGGAQVAMGSPSTLSSNMAYGAVDLVMGGASGGTITAGTLMQDAAAPVGRTGRAVKFSNCTLSGAGQLSWRCRVESVEALKLKNQTAVFQIKVQHDVGSAVNYTTYIRKPNSVDNFTSNTVIAISSAVAVASGTATLLVPWPNGLALGDCSSGLEIEVQMACGAVTAKNFWLTEYQLEEGAVPTPFVYRSYETERRAVERYFERSYDDGVANGAVTGTNGAVVGVTQSGVLNAAFIYLRYRTRKRAVPTLYIYDPSTMNAAGIMVDVNGIRSSTTAYNSDDQGFVLRNTGTQLSANTYCYTQFTADARL